MIKNVLFISVCAKYMDWLLTVKYEDRMDNCVPIKIACQVLTYVYT